MISIIQKMNPNIKYFTPVFLQMELGKFIHLANELSHEKTGLWACYEFAQMHKSLHTNLCLAQNTQMLHRDIKDPDLTARRHMLTWGLNDLIMPKDTVSYDEIPIQTSIGSVWQALIPKKNVIFFLLYTQSSTFQNLRSAEHKLQR